MIISPEFGTLTDPFSIGIVQRSLSVVDSLIDDRP